MGKKWKTTKNHKGSLGKHWKLSKEAKEKIGKAQKGHSRVSGMKGKYHTEESKRKTSEAMKGRIPYLMTEETRKKMSLAKINNPNRVFKDTSIELKIEAELKRRNINYQKQVPLCKIAIVDFYLPEDRIVIQADGDYYHNLTWQKERDIRQDKVLTFNGFNVYRFWEHEINENVKDCIDKLF